MQDLGTLGGAGSAAMANNLAEMAGAGDIQETSAFHAFVMSDQGVTDLGTLGGNQSSALGVNTPGQMVGFSTVADGSVHAFLFSSGQMADLNSLCDVGAGGFRLLTVAKAINDSMVIVGEGIANDGQKHAFMLTPLAIDGGNWSYIAGCNICEPGSREGQWVWIQIDGWWWWESDCGCYRWHGPPGRNPPCPPQPPPCWWWPLPCPENCDCERPPGDKPTPTPPRRTPTVTPTPPNRTPIPQTPPPQWSPTPPKRTPIPQTPTPPRRTPIPQTPRPTRPPVSPPPIKIFTPGVLNTPPIRILKPSGETTPFKPNIQVAPTKPPVQLLNPKLRRLQIASPTPTPPIIR